MKILEEGHGYSLSDSEGSDGSQVLIFVSKQPRIDSEGKVSSDLKTIHNGTTNEEVLLVLIDRLKYLNAKLPCIENEGAIDHLDLALALLNQRTSLRLYRGVEGTNQP